MNGNQQDDLISFVDMESQSSDWYMQLIENCKMKEAHTQNIKFISYSEYDIQFIIYYTYF